MLLRNVLVAVAMLVVTLQSAQAYNEESPNYKWSPNYFGIRGGPVIYSGHLSAPRRMSRFASVYGDVPHLGSSGYDFEGSLASRNPGFYGYSRTDQIKRSVCVGLADSCAVRSGFMGTLMKLPCCPGSVCTLVGHTFKCMPSNAGEKYDFESVYDDNDEDLGEMEYENQA